MASYPIELQNVEKTFHGLHALKNLSLSVEEGEIVALVGRSGSGKSTLIKLLNSTLEPSAGIIKISGHRLSDSKPHSRKIRQKVATIHQGLALVTRLSALENTLQGALGFMAWPRLGIFSYPKHLRLRAQKLLEQLDIGDKSLQPVCNLSGGQQQRVAIARALMQQPEIILADEPISALDPETSIQVLSLLKRVAQNNHLTLIVAIHQIEFVEGFASRVIGLKSGEIALDVPANQFNSQLSKQIFSDVN